MYDPKLRVSSHVPEPVAACSQRTAAGCQLVMPPWAGGYGGLVLILILIVIVLRTNDVVDNAVTVVMTLGGIGFTARISARRLVFSARLLP